MRLKSRRLRTYLAALVLAAVLPLMAAGIAAIWDAARTARAMAEDRLLETATLMAFSVESELGSRSALLLALGPDIPAPQISHLFLDGPQQRPLLTVTDELSAVAITLPPAELLKLASQPAASVLAAVVDGNGRLVARSRDSERFVGRQVPDWAKLQAIPGTTGLFEARTAEGGVIVFAFHRLARPADWVVVVGEPMEAFNARWQVPTYRLMAVGAAALLAALLAAGWLSRRILSPMRQLARRAQKAATDDHPPAPDQPPAEALPVAEFEVIRRRIEAAQTALRGRAQAERAAASAAARNELRYRTLAQVGTVVLWRADATGQVLAANGWAGFTGQPEAGALGRRWLRRVHPADREALCHALRQAGTLVDAECRLATAVDVWHWVRLRGAVVRDDSGQVAEWVGVLEDVHERRTAQARLDHLARHDALTGLPNRSALTGRLDEATRRSASGQRAALLYLDLDRFKAVNDSLGHAVGDALLVAVSHRLQSLVRASDIAVRLGGDEFVVLQAPLDSEADATGLATRIVDTLGARYQIDQHVVEVGVSVGIALANPGLQTGDELLRRADTALYLAKREGRGCYRIGLPDG